MGTDFLLDYAARRWKSYHRMIHNISSSDGIADMHLIQPNPLVAGSKLLSTKEKQDIGKWSPVPFTYHVAKGYPKLQAAVADMKTEGLTAVDLTYVYKDMKEPIWIDAAHANRTGCKIIMDRIFEHIENGRYFAPKLSAKAN